MDPDVLIIGAGPTGLMMACQLLRFGISFRIIEKEADRSKESRALGIQERSMEIFQNLGLEDEFLKEARSIQEFCAYFFGKPRIYFDFSHIDVSEIQTPRVYLLPQSDTERILAGHLERANIGIERRKKLLSFEQSPEGIHATIESSSGQREKINCRYIVGCDGARSTVREQLQIPFAGSSYQQEFVLADVTVKWPTPQKEIFKGFLSNKGILVGIPLRHYSRLIMAGLDSKAQPSLEQIEAFVKEVTATDVKLENPIWISRFYLHHRVVERYQQGRAFLAGDAAHIHSPVGGQGMNTGLQDATNLAWKLALVLKYKAPPSLLETYQSERQRIGEILLKTTDRIFGLLTSQNFLIKCIKLHIVPYIMGYLTRSQSFRKKLYCYMSQLAIHYHESAFVVEKAKGADKRFLKGPKAGARAPNAPVLNSSLFELFREKPCHILIFQDASPLDEQKIKELAALSPNLIAIHRFVRDLNHQLLFDRYGISHSGLYFIRPDGYIGFRAYGYDFESLKNFLSHLLNPCEAKV